MYSKRTPVRLKATRDFWKLTERFRNASRRLPLNERELLRKEVVYLVLVITVIGTKTCFYKGRSNQGLSDTCIYLFYFTCLLRPYKIYNRVQDDVKSGSRQPTCNGEDTM